MSCVSQITNPVGQYEVNEQSVSNGDFSFDAKHDGKYVYCFGNEHWGASSKEVSFNVHGIVYVSEADAPQDPLEVEVRKLSELLELVKDEQSYIVVRERTHRNTAESTNSRVKWWNLFVIGVVIGESVFQVWWLRRFFEVCRHPRLDRDEEQDNVADMVLFFEFRLSGLFKATGRLHVVLFASAMQSAIATAAQDLGAQRVKMGEGFCNLCLASWMKHVPFIPLVSSQFQHDRWARGIPHQTDGHYDNMMTNKLAIHISGVADGKLSLSHFLDARTSPIYSSSRFGTCTVLVQTHKHRPMLSRLSSTFPFRGSSPTQ